MSMIIMISCNLKKVGRFFAKIMSYKWVISWYLSMLVIGFLMFLCSITHCERKLSNLEVSSSSNYSIVQVTVEKELKERLEAHNCCHLVVKPYSIVSSVLTLPVKFARKNGLVRRVNVTIIDRKGISKAMEIRLSQGRWPYIGSWSPFQIAQNIKAGDRIVLEVLKSGPKPVLKLHVL